MDRLDENSKEIVELVERLELLSGRKVSLGERLDGGDSKNIKGAVGRPKKISNPILALVVHQVLYKAVYEEMVIKGRSHPLPIIKACELLAAENISRRNPDLGALRFLIIDKLKGEDLTEPTIVAGCASSIRRLYNAGIKKSQEDPVIKSKIQAIFIATRKDILNII